VRRKISQAIQNAGDRLTQQRRPQVFTYRADTGAADDLSVLHAEAISDHGRWAAVFWRAATAIFTAAQM
jgi:hypothetical protein